MKKNKLTGILAITLVFAMMVTACPDGDDNGGNGGNGDPVSATYTSYDSSGNEYKLVVTKGANRAAYTPQIGDTFVLTIKNASGTVIGTSTGTVTVTVTNISGDTFTLDNEGDTFTVVASGNTITSIPNAIPLDGNGTQPQPGSLTSDRPDTGGGTTFAVAVNNGTGGGNYVQGATVSITANAAPQGQQFKNWTTTSAGVTFANANSASTTFAMPANAVTVTANYAIPTLGDTGPGGGIIFYYNANSFTMTDTGQTCYYLEAARSDLGSLAWASSDFTSTNIPGTVEKGIGTGRKNTALILATDVNAPAAKACSEYRGGGKDDWFLPGIDELNQLHINRAIVGNLLEDSYSWYWSSSQATAANKYDCAWLRDFGDGRQYNTQKFAPCRVRAIWAF
jgi:hypothetical protein